MAQAHYFAGRRRIGNPVLIQLDKNSKLECSVYQKWIDTEQGVELACGQTDTVGFSIACGVSEKALTSLVSKIGSSLGVKDVAALSLEISETIGYEVNWSVTKTLTHSAPCTAPKCGRLTLEIQQLVREYELTLHTRRGFIFKSWDQHPTRTIVERTEKHSLWPTSEEYDERCKDCNRPASPGYDGRLIVEAGHADLFLPYKLTSKGADVRVLNKVVSFKFAEFAAGVSQLQDGAHLLFPQDAFSSHLLFFIGRVEVAEGNILVHARVDHRRAYSAPLQNLQVTPGIGLIAGKRVDLGQPVEP